MFADRLKLARKCAGLSMPALAGRIGFGSTAKIIKDYEHGRGLPSTSVLSRLSDVLGVSMGFLLGRRVLALKDVEWRKQSGASAKELARAEVLAIERVEKYLEIESVLDLQPIGDTFADLRVDTLIDEREIERAALNLREKWRLGIDPIPSMTALLEEKGLVVIQGELPKRIGGLTCRVECEGREPVEVIVVSRDGNVERRRFSLAHELAHRIIVDTASAGRQHESLMNRFAGAFLIQREHLMASVGKDRSRMTLNELFRLKKLYGVSAAAMLMRLGQVDILPQEVVAGAFKTFARNWRKNEPEPMRDLEGFAAFERPQRFENLVWQALGERLIIPLRAARLLDIRLKEVEAALEK